MGNELIPTISLWTASAPTLALVPAPCLASRELEHCPDYLLQAVPTIWFPSMHCRNLRFRLQRMLRSLGAVPEDRCQLLLAPAQTNFAARYSIMFVTTGLMRTTGSVTGWAGKNLRCAKTILAGDLEGRYTCHASARVDPHFIEAGTGRSSFSLMKDCVYSNRRLGFQMCLLWLLARQP